MATGLCRFDRIEDMLGQLNDAINAIRSRVSSSAIRSLPDMTREDLEAYRDSLKTTLAVVDAMIQAREGAK